MRNFITKHLVVILWSIVAMGTAIIFFLWVSRDIGTSRDANESNRIVAQIQEALDKHQGDTERDHDGQDELLQCIVNLFLVRETITELDVENCVIQTQVPQPTSQDEDTEPQHQGSTPSSQSSASPSSSSLNSTPSQPTVQPDNSQNPPETPTEPDNDGVIVDLPLLPKIHIPSPL